jgi:O-antigen ligase
MPMIPVSARLAWALTGIIGIVALGAVAAVLESGVAAERVASMGKAWSDRWNIFGLVLGGIGRNVWTGTGLGAFIDAFPLYRGAQAGYGGLWNAAHNIYLESLFGLGLPAFLLLAGAVGWAVARCAVGAARRRRRATAPVAAALASLFLLGHGLVDFSVQTPAVAYAWAALLGFGCAQSWRSRASR